MSLINGRGAKLPPTSNEEQFKRMEDLIGNALSIRQGIFQQLMDPRRDLEAECGYPSLTEAIPAEMYRQLYDREAIATRIVQLYPKESWQLSPTIYEDEDSKHVTPFEEAWDALEVGLENSQSWHQDEKGSTLWDMLLRADILSGIGHFGVILLGIDDGKNLQEPVEGVQVFNKRGHPLTNAQGQYVGWRYELVPNERGTMPDSSDTPQDQAEMEALRNMTEAGSFQTTNMAWDKSGIHRSTTTHKAAFLNDWKQPIPAPIQRQNSHPQQQRVDNSDEVYSANSNPEGHNQYNSQHAESLKQHQNKQNRKPYQPHLLTEEHMEGLREAGLIEKNKKAKITQEGYNLLHRAEQGEQEDIQREVDEVERGRIHNAAFHRPENYDTIKDLLGGYTMGAGANDWEVGWSAVGIHKGDPRQTEPIEWRGIDHSSCPGCEGHNSEDEDGSSSKEAKRQCSEWAQKTAHAWVKDRLPTVGARIKDTQNRDAEGELPENEGVSFSQEVHNGEMDSEYSDPINNDAWGEQGRKRPTNTAKDSKGQALFGEDKGGAAPNPGTDEQYAWQGAMPPAALSGTDQQYFGIHFGPSEAFPQEGPAGANGPNTSGSKKDPKNQKPTKRLIFLRTFDESLVQVVRWEWNIRNPRFGMPVMYRITLNDPREQHSGVGLPMATVFVHWSRIIHLADNLGSSIVIGVPRMQNCLNRILDLRKLYSASAEGYWKSAFTGMSLETNPQLGGDVVVDKAGLMDMWEQYQNGLQRVLLLSGMTAKSIAPSVLDPSGQIDVQITAICIVLGCPKRVFMGSERGELASSQDDSQWNDVKRHRQHFYVTPKIIVPFIDRLIQLGVLPEPEGYTVEWPDLESIGKSDKATIANTNTTALGAYVSGGLEAIMTKMDYLTRIMGFEEEEAKEIIDSVEEEAKKKAEEHQGIADEHGFQPAPPPGFQEKPPAAPPAPMAPLPPTPPPLAPVKMGPGQSLMHPQTGKVIGTAPGAPGKPGGNDARSSTPPQTSGIAATAKAEAQPKPPTPPTPPKPSGPSTANLRANVSKLQAQHGELKGKLKDIKQRMQVRNLMTDGADIVL